MHRIGFFVCRGYDALDLGGPLSAFNQVATAAGHAPYGSTSSRSPAARFPAIRACRSTRSRSEGACSTPSSSWAVTSIRCRRRRTSPPPKTGRQGCAGRKRVYGAFLLAETGLLDGVSVTTHWRYAAQLQSRFPRAKVEGDSIYIEAGRIWTSAGIASGIDLALGLIERIWARRLRALSPGFWWFRIVGGQSQFSAMSQMEPESDRIRIALNFAREHLAEALPVERLAEAASLSLRQFGRAFRRETGETPAKAVERCVSKRRGCACRAAANRSSRSRWLSGSPTRNGCGGPSSNCMGTRRKRFDARADRTARADRPSSAGRSARCLAEVPLAD